MAADLPRDKTAAEVETALGDHPGDGGVVLVDLDSWSPCADFGKSVLRLLPATETYAVALSAKPALGEATVADLSVAAVRWRSAEGGNTLERWLEGRGIVFWPAPAHYRSRTFAEPEARDRQQRAQERALRICASAEPDRNTGSRLRSASLLPPATGRGAPAHTGTRRGHARAGRGTAPAGPDDDDGGALRAPPSSSVVFEKFSSFVRKRRHGISRILVF